MAMPVETIINKFETQRRLATLIEVDQSTIAQWKKRGVIPSTRIQSIITAAAQNGISLTYDEFFRVPVK